MVVQLVGLKGVKKKKIDAVYIDKASDIYENLTKKVALTSAGSNGALNVWINDKGIFNCESMRYMASIEHKQYNNINDAKIWLEKWLPQII